MGLAGGIVRRVFSKSPCSSAGGGGRGCHNVRAFCCCVHCLCRAHCGGAVQLCSRCWGSGSVRKSEVLLVRQSVAGDEANVLSILYLPWHHGSWIFTNADALPACDINNLCGDEISAAAEEDNDDDDDGMVSVKSFETCAMPQEPQAAVATVARTANGVDGSADADGHRDEQGSMSIPVKDTAPPTAESATDSQDEAATMIQSAFRGFMARRQLQKLKCSENGCCTDEPRSPTTASIAASVEVQVSESLSNLRLSDDSAAAAATSVQHRSSQRSRPQAFRVKEEWDDSTVSSNVSRMRMRSRIEATTRRERALAYAFSQQLRSCGGAAAGTTKKRAARSDQTEFNVGWSWLERWMATRQASEASADDCMSKNAADAGSTAAAGGRRVIVVRRRHDLAGAGEEKESCGSNDVSVVSFDGSSGSLSCYKPGSKSRLRGGGRSLPRRKVASSDHRLHARSHKVSKKVHRRDQEQEQQQQREEAAAEAYDGNQPPTDY